jgi:electron-transferring-flavoprotein dehydrogenase
VEIYPGFAATEVLTNEDGAVIGVATGDMGVERNGEPGPNYARGMALHGKYTLIGEGVRGSLAKQLISNFKLDEDREPQKYGIGLKELWEVKPEHHRQGLVQHSFGWPLDMKTGGGSFLYHLEDNQVAVGFVVHLNYKNPWYLCRHSRSSSVSRRIRRSRRCSRAASGSATARARFPKAAGSRCRSWRFPAVR